MELTFDLRREPRAGGSFVPSWELREGTALRGQGGDEFVLSSGVPIGSGKSGKVYSGAVVASGVAVAIKVIDRMEIECRPDKIKRVTRELNIRRKLRHPNLINLLDVAFDDFRAMLIMEMADGGMLFDLVSAGTPLPEGRARYLFKQMVSAVSYCHDLQIYHRDLKLENIMLASDGTDTLKIADFGASNREPDSIPKATSKHAPGSGISYMAPEVTNVSRRQGDESSYGAGADIWSLGVILYVLTTCSYPFGFDGPRRLGGISAAKVYQNIRRGADAVDFPVTMSPELVELLRGTALTPH
jgi:serine/threonine protein kinase